MRNARFWIMGCNSNPVKLTLRPGQSLAHHTFERTDEGYSASYSSYTHDGDSVVCEYGSEGRDCDGRHAYHSESRAPLARLKDGWTDDTDRAVTYPAWTQGDSSQRDEYAEAMGY